MKNDVRSAMKYASGLTGLKLFHKIFLCFVVLFGIAFQTAGALLIDYAYENAIEQEKKYALQQFQYNKYILQSILYSEPDLMRAQEGNPGNLGSFTAPVALYDQQKNRICSNLSMEPDTLDFRDSEDGRLAFSICQKDGESCIFVYDHVRQGESEAYLVTQTDISSVVDAQRNMTAYFQRIYLILVCIGFPLIFLLTNLLTGSIKKVSKAARRIARGKYAERIDVGTTDEIGQLAADFNRMAEKIEEKVRELSRAARAKEDFTANFAHELKTPLTSVIGYADMLYQRELPRKQVKEAAGYILNEGMRLEALSLKLMDLFVLDRQDFYLEKQETGGLFADMLPGIKPVCEKHGVQLHMDIEEGEIPVEFDLFKTMVLNIVDNAVKADCRDIWIIGEQQRTRYQISLKDNGKGIPPAELDRITEAFYMVDKSRSRKQHGAGLGMALVARIVKLHRATMRVESDGRSGTTVRILFSLPGGGWDEEDV